MAEPPKNKKLFSVSNIITALLIVFVVSTFIFPEVKATVLRGLMKIGLFQPSASVNANNIGSGRQWTVQLSGAGGATVNGNTLHAKVVFINIWATWCPPCIAEMPSVNDLYKTLKTDPDVLFLTIDADNDLPQAEKFMRDRNFDLPVFTAPSGLPDEWFGGSLPTTIVLDKKGNIAFTHTGVANYNSNRFKKMIADLRAM